MDQFACVMHLNDGEPPADASDPVLESIRSIDSSGLSLLATWERQAGFGVKAEQLIGACFFMAFASVHHSLIIIKTVSIEIHT
jgi:hypothetical protein